MEYVAIYKNGYLLHTVPPLSDYYNERDKFTHARYIISDDVDYDLEDISSINEILIPDFSQPIITNTPGEFTLGVTGSLEYVLRRKAVELRKRKENYLSITLLKKVCKIMPYSRISWRMNDYMRLVNWLYEDERFDEADFYEEKFSNMFNNNSNNSLNKIHQRQINSIISLGYDLCMTSNNFGCCEECAKRRNRVFSISGKDKRFYKYTEYHCSCSRLALLMFRENSDEHYFKNENYIEYSNRPFIDDRTDEEKERYQFDCDRKVYEEILERDKKLFNKMKAIIPDFPFKSFRSYRSSSKKKIKEYAKIAINYEMNILPTKEEKEIIERYLKTKKEKGWR